MKKYISIEHYFCDGCGEIMDDECDMYDISDKNNIDMLDPHEGDWIEHGESHYCPDCYEVKNHSVFIKTKIA